MDNKSVVGADSAWRSSINCRRIAKTETGTQRTSLDGINSVVTDNGGLVHRTISQSLYACSWAKVHNNRDMIAFQNTTRNKNILKIISIKTDAKKAKDPQIEVRYL